MGQVAWGIANGFDARETARKAAQQALIKIGTGRPALAICFMSHEFNIDQALGGMIGMLGNLPIWGFSTEFPLTIEGEHERSILIVVISGKDLVAETMLVEKEENFAGHQGILSGKLRIKEPSAYLLAGDGANGFPHWLLDEVNQIQARIAGCLGSGEYYQGATRQFAGNRSALESVAVAALGGNFQIGVGVGHGWQDMGFVFPVGRFENSMILELDGVSPVEKYERVFDFPAAKWKEPPLSDIISMYPLGIELFPGSADLILRAPVKVESDGSLKFNAPMADGQIAHIMVGNVAFCLEAVQQALNAAKSQIYGCHALAVFVLMDYGWHLLFKEKVVEVMKLIQKDVDDLPVVGAYTMGHIHSSDQGSGSQVLNQNVMIMILAEK